jgi:hypothetical protein
MVDDGEYNLVHVENLSKAFVVPLAFIARSVGFINYLRASAPTLTHNSLLAILVLSAALAV